MTSNDRILIRITHSIAGGIAFIIVLFAMHLENITYARLILATAAIGFTIFFLKLKKHYNISKQKKSNN